MQIKKYDILLRSVHEEDIELIREKRNSEAIQNKMHYREIITPEMQKLWFSNIYMPGSTSLYFVIHHNNKKIGLINGKPYEGDPKSSEGGIFIWEPEYWGSLIPVMASLITLDFCFIILNNKSNHIRILKTNKNAIFYNKKLGYKPIEKYTPDNECQYYRIIKDDYLKNVEKIRKGLSQLTNDFDPLNLKNINFDDTSDEVLISVYQHLPMDQKELTKKILENNNRSIVTKLLN